MPDTNEMLTDAEAERLTDKVMTVGQSAAAHAMGAMTDYIAQRCTDNHEKMAVLAGALAFNRWKIGVTLDALQKMEPSYVELVKGIEKVLEQEMSSSFAEFARESAGKFGIKLKD